MASSSAIRCQQPTWSFWNWIMDYLETPLFARQVLCFQKSFVCLLFLNIVAISSVNSRIQRLSADYRLAIAQSACGLKNEDSGPSTAKKSVASGFHSIMVKGPDSIQMILLAAGWTFFVSKSALESGPNSSITHTFRWTRPGVIRWYYGFWVCQTKTKN
jgi:hypothetical protein